jgi:hypothetical protein
MLSGEQSGFGVDSVFVVVTSFFCLKLIRSILPYVFIWEIDMVNNPMFL